MSSSLMNLSARKCSSFIYPVILSSLFAFASCTQDKSDSASVDSSQKSQVAFSSDLLGRLPENITGVLHWDLSTEGYQKLAQSPWADFSHTSVSNAGLSEGVDSFRLSLKRADINLEDKKQVQDLLTEGAIFTVPQKSGEKEIETKVGIIFRSASAEKRTEALTRLESSVKKDNPGEVSQLEIPNGKGFVVSGALQIAVGWTPEFCVISKDKQLVEAVIGKTGGAVPALYSQPEVLKATEGFPPSAERIASGYCGVQSCTSLLNPTMLESINSPGNTSGVDIESSGLQAIAFASSMSEVPENDFRVVFDSEQSSQTSILSHLKNSSAKSIIEITPGKPLLLVTLDTTLLRELRNSLVPSTDTATRKSLEFLDSVGRIAIIGQAAPLGQALLPVPDLLVALETEEPQKALESIQKFVSDGIQAMGVGNFPWTDKDIDGTPAKVISTPFGLGVALGIHKSTLLIASTENQLRSALTQLKSGESSFSKSLNTKAADFLIKEDSVSAFYLNFEQIGAMVENMGGLLSMYAPSSPDAQELLQQQNIKTLKSLGVLVGSATAEKNMIRIRTFYQPIPQQVAMTN